MFVVVSDIHILRSMCAEMQHWLLDAGDTGMVGGTLNGQPAQCGTMGGVTSPRSILEHTPRNGDQHPPPANTVAGS